MNLYQVVVQVWNALIIILIIWMIYINYIKPLRTFNDYKRRAINYEVFLRNKKKAIFILNEAIKVLILTNIERAGILLELGVLYFKQGNYEQAAKYFDSCFEIVIKENFRYDKKLIYAIKAYIYINKKEKAISLYSNLIRRQSYDINFRKIKRVQSLLGFNK